MSDFTRKVVDGLGSLLTRVRADDTPLAHVDELELERELKARKTARRKGQRADENPIAKLATGTTAARKQRGAAAKKRADSIHRAREQREKKEQAASDASFRRAKEQANRAKEADFQAWKQATRGGKRPPRSSRSGFNFGENKEIAKHYKVLDLPYDSELAEVKKSYRKLMRKYHPDLHRGSDAKQKAANELSVKVTQAYNELEKYLKGK